MENRKLMLYIGLAFVSFLLWNAWQQSHPAATTATTVSASPVVTTTGSTNSSAVAPSLAIQQATSTNNTGKSVVNKHAKTMAVSTKTVTVKTDFMDVVIDLKGGNIIKASLPGYSKTLKEKSPVDILNDTDKQFNVVQSGLVGNFATDTALSQVMYQAKATHYTLQPGQKQLVVTLRHEQEGVTVIKQFTFKPGKYAIDIAYQLENQSGKTWQGAMFGQLLRQKPVAEHSSGFMGLHTYDGAALSTADKPYKKVTYSAMSEDNLDQVAAGGWVAMQQRYFLSAWVPNQQQNNHYYSLHNGSDRYTIGWVGPRISVPTGASTKVNGSVYIGPELGDQLDSVAKHLSLTIDYGFLWPISVAIFWVMKHIHRIIGNWGWSIILVTLLIKLLFYKLSEKSLVSMAKMRTLQPKMEALKKQYGDDKQKMGKVTMELYRKEKINPMGGCLPMLVQIPFFIALYWVLIESVQLRHAPFIFWIHDLSAKDPYYILPVLMGISMFALQKLSPAPADPTQAKMMMFMPLLFTAMFVTFPSGLVLYWLTNNCLQGAQQWYITQKIEGKRGKKPAKSKSKQKK